MSARLYFDWNASAPLHPAAKVAMLTALDVVGNPSSIHAEGRRAKAVVETARDHVADLMEVATADVIFTSGASEANATVLASGWDTIVLSDLEHDSVLEPARRSGAQLRMVPVMRSGEIDVGQLADAVMAVPIAHRTLVVLQAANNETGVIQPVAEVAGFARTQGAAVLVDAVQAVGRLPLAAMLRDATFVTMSSHKLGGPKGVGALVVRDGAALVPLIAGGGQERRRRAGTESVAAIAGFGAAAAAVDLREAATMAGRRDRLERALCAMTPEAIVVGAAAPRLPNTLCLAATGRDAATTVIRLDLAGAAISAGAACSSGKVGASRVLSAMALPIDQARGAVRISLGPTTSDADIDAFLSLWTTLVRPAAHAA